MTERMARAFPPARLRFAVLYLAWIAVCAIAFFAVRGAEDPSRRPGRILPTDAGVRAVQILQGIDRQRFAAYEPVHVAWASRGEGGTENRWVVLCDRVPHTALHDAVVVELRGADGRLLTIRKPVD